MNLIVSWFNSRDLKIGKYGVAAALFTDDFVRSLNKFVLEYT